MKTTLCHLLGIEYPIIAAPMASQGGKTPECGPAERARGAAAGQSGSPDLLPLATGRDNPIRRE